MHFRILKHDLGNLTDLLDGTENIIENRKKVNPKLFGIVEKHQIIEEYVLLFLSNNLIFLVLRRLKNHP